MKTNQERDGIKGRNLAASNWWVPGRWQRQLFFGGAGIVRCGTYAFKLQSCIRLNLKTYAHIWWNNDRCTVWEYGLEGRLCAHHIVWITSSSIGKLFDMTFWRKALATLNWHALKLNMPSSNHFFSSTAFSIFTHLETRKLINSF